MSVCLSKVLQYVNSAQHETLTVYILSMSGTFSLKNN